MKRREFIYQSAAGTAFLTIGGLPAFSQNKLKGIQQNAYQSGRELPVVYNVDVVVVGGSTAGVAAAVKAAQNGAKVFLASREPYLGEDVCGTYRYWREDTNFQTSLEKQIWGNGLPTPLHVKSTLDQQLIDNGVQYLYSSYATDLIVDEKGNPAGVVMANRSGRQAVIAKVIIDATPRATVAKMTNARFSEFRAGKQLFKFTVVGNKEKIIEGGVGKIQPSRIKIEDNSYQAIEYAIPVEMRDGSWSSFAEAEQIIQDLTWDADQVDKSDLLFQNPPDKMKGQKHWKELDAVAEEIPLKVFQPQKVDRFFVLSASADLSNEVAEKLLEPGALIGTGERIGNEAAIIASQTSFEGNLSIKSSNQSAEIKGDVGELLLGIRPSFTLGFLVEESTSLPVLGKYDTVVMGGGTAGAPAGIGAARNGASTLVLEYMHGLGGIGTMGLVGGYWFGFREGFTEEVDQGVKNIGGDNPRKKDRTDIWVTDWKREWYRREVRKAGGTVWFGVLGCGAYVENGKVKGVVVATPEGKGVVLAHTVIDSTGSADIAIAAGAEYSYTDAETVAIQGAGLPFKYPDLSYKNTDWTFINDTDMLDVWRTFVVAKNKFKGHYDIGKLMQTRERRRIVGDLRISVLDIYNHRTYPDTISIHISSFETHGYTIDPFFSLKAPGTKEEGVMAHVPFRSLLPKGLDGIIVTGLGVSAHRDAMPVIRMQADLQNQGFAVGMASAMVAADNKQIRDVEIEKLQQKLVEKGNLLPEVLNQADNYPPEASRIEQAAKSVVNDLEGLEIVLWDKKQGIPALKNEYTKSSNPEPQLVYARILGMLGIADGFRELHNAVKSLENWDNGWDFRGMEQYGSSMSYDDSLLIGLGNCKQTESIPAIKRMAEKLTPESHFSHFRAVAIAFETISNESGAKVLHNMLQMPGMAGHAMTDIEEAIAETPLNNPTDTSTREFSLRELILARALYRCGDYNGLGRKILLEYSNDLRGHYYRHANGVLNKYS